MIRTGTKNTIILPTIINNTDTTADIINRDSEKQHNSDNNNRDNTWYNQVCTEKATINIIEEEPMLKKEKIEKER